MKRKLWFAVLAVLLWSPMAMAANSVVVETKSVALNAAGVPIGIYVTNDVILQQYVQPLKLVSVSGGAFITGLQVSPNASARMNGKLAEIMIYNGYQTPDGACFTTAPNVGFGTIWPGPDGIPSTGDEGIDLPNPPMPVTSSPAALMVVRGKVFGATLPAGTDGTFPGGSPSFTIGVGINGCSGQFEVDTTCTDPANHLVFAKLTAPVAVIPTFQKGVITVGTGVNQPPVAVNDTYNTNEDTPLEVPAPGVIGNDTDCQPLTAVKVTDPSHGAVTLNSDGSFTYAPEPNYSGPDAFTYNASDGAAQGNTATVSITVLTCDVNAGPDKVLTCTVTQINLSGSTSTPGAIFSWAASGGGNIVSGANTATPLVNAAGIYTLTVTNVEGCQARDTALVTRNNTAPDANAGPDKVLTCVVTQINLAGSSSTGGATFAWVASAGGHIMSGATTATPLVDAVGTYTLTVTNPANGCTATDVALVIQNVTPPNANAGPDKVLDCAVTQVNLAGSSTTPGATFSWVASNGGNIVSGANTATPLVNAAGTYTLTVTNPANGCTATDVALVTQNVTPPNANAGPDKVLNCTVTQINLSGSSSTPGATFSWVASNGGNIVSGANTATPLVNAAGTYTLTVANPANGCTASDVALVTLNVTPPNASAGPDKVLDCAVTQVNLAGSSTTPGATFSWVASAGGHIVSGANTATPLVDAAGTYTLTVTNPANGCTASDVALVTLNATPPNVNAGSDKVLTCTVTQINLSGSSSTPGATFSWVASNGGNIVSGANTATPLVNAAGTYTLTVTNPANGCTASDVALVTLNVTPPNASAGPDKVLTCVVTQVNLAGSSSTPGATFSWVASAGGHIVSGANTATPLIDAAGTYTLTVTDPANGCTATDVALVTRSNTAPDANAGPDKVLNCTVTQINLSGSSSTPGATFSWVASAGGHIVSGANTATPLVDAAGTYTLTVTDPANGCTATDVALVTQNVTPPNANAGPDKVLDCAGTPVNLAGSSSTPGATFSWVASAGGHIVSGANTATPLIDAAGTYTLTVTDPANGCTATDVALVTQNVTPPNANAGPDKVLNCTVTQINLSGSSSTPGATFSWVASNGGNIVSGANTATPLVNAAGTYTLTVANPANGCTASDVALVTLNVTPPNASAGPDKVLDCAVTQVNLAGSSTTPGATFSWVASASGHIVSGANTATPLIDAAGTYTLTVTDPANGCTASDVALVTQNVTPPNANAGPDKVLNCTVTQINLSGSSSTPGATFSWVASAGGHIVSGANTATPLVDAAGTYTLTVTDPANGCSATDVALVTQDITKPVLSCAGDELTGDSLMATASVTSIPSVGVSYIWFPDPVSGQGTPFARYDTPGSKKVVVTILATGCRDSCEAVITGTPVVNHPPVARDTSWATNQDTPKAVAYLPASDADAGQVLTYAIVSGPAHGGISGFNSATGAFTYTPTGGYSGPDVLTFSACDNGAPSLCDTGTVSITVNVNNTPAGTNVLVALPGPVTLNFQHVDVAGITTLTTGSVGPPPPAGFQILPPSQPVYYDLWTTAQFTGLVTVCFPYDPSTTVDPASLQLLHYDAGQALWVQVLPVTIDQVAHTICGDVSSFSIFAVGTPIGTGGELASRIMIRPFAWQPTKKASPSQGKVNGWIGNLESGHGVAEILASSIRLNGTVPILERSAKIVGFDEGFTGPVLMVSFDRQQAMASLGPVPPGMYTVVVTGSLTGGATFRGETEVRVPGSPKTVVEEDLPFDFELGQSYPNPANPSANIEFALPYDGETRLEVFDILGRRVRTLVDGFRMAGRQTVTWDGRDANGNEVGSGVYLYRLVFDQSVQTKKLILLK